MFLTQDFIQLSFFLSNFTVESFQLGFCIYVVLQPQGAQDSFAGFFGIEKNLDLTSQGRLFGGTIEVVDRYVAMHTRVRVRCKTCGYEWNPKPYYLIQGHGCHKCAGLYQGTVVCLETGKEYENYRQAALAVGLKGGAGIKDACQNSSRTAGGFHWILKEKQ